MSRLPDALFVVDTRKEKIAVDEARKLKIPVIGVVDTNCDPDEVDYVIPGNDDALRAIRLFASRIADAIVAGRGIRESARPTTPEGKATTAARRGRANRPGPRPSRPPPRRLSKIRGLAADVAGLNDGPAFFCTVASFQLPVSSKDAELKLRSRSSPMSVP